VIVQGTADAIVPAEVSRTLARPLADVEILGAGHVPTMTRANEVAQAILRRLA